MSTMIERGLGRRAGRRPTRIDTVLQAIQRASSPRMQIDVAIESLAPAKPCRRSLRMTRFGAEVPLKALSERLLKKLKIKAAVVAESEANRNLVPDEPGWARLAHQAGPLANYIENL